MEVREAFMTLCKDAKPANRRYVSLYANVPFYGGPEEGGWWGSDNKLVAYYEAESQREAERIQAAVKTLAEKLSKESEEAFGRRCQAEIEWCEARGIDDPNAVLGEVDGATEYVVLIERFPGEFSQKGSRHYE